MTKPALNGFMRSIVLGLAIATALGLAATVPALALDDGQESIFGAIGGIVGIVSPTPKADIDYRERPPLVLPPKMQLRKPQQPLAERDPKWPVDPDVEARRKAEADAKIPILPFTAKEATARSSKPELLKDRIAAQRSNVQDVSPCTSEGRNCSKWDPSQGGNLPQVPDVVVVGQEPDREVLTDPPKGYRLATKAVKATTEPPRQAEDTSPRGFYRKKPQTDE